MRRRAFILLTVGLPVLRYALILETARLATLGSFDAHRPALIAVLTVILWVLNGATLVSVLVWLRRRFRRQEA